MLCITQSLKIEAVSIQKNLTSMRIIYILLLLSNYCYGELTLDDYIIQKKEFLSSVGYGDQHPVYLEINIAKSVEEVDELLKKYNPPTPNDLMQQDGYISVFYTINMNYIEKNSVIREKIIEDLIDYVIPLIKEGKIVGFIKDDKNYCLIVPYKYAHFAAFPAKTWASAFRREKIIKHINSDFLSKFNLYLDKN